MKNLFKPVFAIILILFSIALMYIQYTSDYSSDRLSLLLSANIVNLLALAIVIFFLFYKAYKELSQDVRKIKSYLKALLLLLLPFLMVVTIITDINLITSMSLQASILFRFTSILIMIYNIDVFLDNKNNASAKIVVTVFATVLFSSVFMLDGSVLNFIVTFFYGMSMIFLLYLMVINTREGKTK